MASNQSRMYYMNIYLFQERMHLYFYCLFNSSNLRSLSSNNLQYPVKIYYYYSTNNFDSISDLLQTCWNFVPELSSSPNRNPKNASRSEFESGLFSQNTYSGVGLIPPPKHRYARKICTHTLVGKFVSVTLSQVRLFLPFKKKLLFSINGNRFRPRHFWR